MAIAAVVLKLRGDDEINAVEGSESDLSFSEIPPPRRVGLKTETASNPRFSIAGLAAIPLFPEIPISDAYRSAIELPDSTCVRQMARSSPKH
ncbi:hypothetical protein AVEN_64167-1 [Araneus ventricosus]|uniref:Uncharacterized protein n=1 Tax=Araneus ventricosus TaxID=182803 RepID=A0A4Y2QG74_ARAVE|nr:hypothetical protein AVEN_64167-1 [Araneus ventricosus]